MMRKRTMNTLLPQIPCQYILHPHHNLNAVHHVYLYQQSTILLVDLQVHVQKQWYKRPERAQHMSRRHIEHIRLPNRMLEHRPITPTHPLLITMPSMISAKCLRTLIWVIRHMNFLP